MSDIFQKYSGSINFSDELHLKHSEEMIVQELEWQKWLASKGAIFKEIEFPPTALIDRFHFSSYICDGLDFFPYEPFEIENLTNKEALKVLLALEDYVTQPLMSWILLDLRKRFNLSCDFEDDGETWPVIPPHLITEILSE
jgi:hypothetical protein